MLFESIVIQPVSVLMEAKARSNVLRKRGQAPYEYKIRILANGMRLFLERTCFQNPIFAQAANGLARRAGQDPESLNTLLASVIHRVGIAP